MFDLLKPYIAMARPDYWPKQIFMLVGVMLAELLMHDGFYINGTILLGLVAVCLAASANYVINEWLDREFDAKHPKKYLRPAPQGLVSARGVYIEYALFCLASIAVGMLVNGAFTAVIALLLASGVVYNVKPLRFKDYAYLDVLAESANNPIRLLLGWFTVTAASIPPSSLVLVFWLGGAFLMAMKRFAEYRLIMQLKDKATAGMYRPSFARYTPEKLLLFSFLMAFMVAFCFAAFVIKHREEYLLLFPFAGGLFTHFLYLGLQDNSIVQTPEKLFLDARLLMWVVMCCAAFVVLSFVDMPLVQAFVHSDMIVTDGATQ